jgi:hypothetical protein
MSRKPASEEFLASGRGNQGEMCFMGAPAPTALTGTNRAREHLGGRYRAAIYVARRWYCPSMAENRISHGQEAATGDPPESRRLVG